MKNFTLTFLLMSLTYLIQAQITLNHWEYPLEPNDTFQLTMANGGSTSIPFTGGANQTWDYSDLSFGSPIPIVIPALNAVNQTTYPNANIQRIWYVRDLVNFHPDSLVIASDNRGLIWEGVQDIPFSHNIASYTGNAGDQLTKLKKDHQWATPMPLVGTPLNYADSVAITNHRSSDYLLTSPTLGLSDEPLERRRTLNYSYSVIGWGNLILTNPATMLPDTFEVLLQRQIREVVDTFYDASGNLFPHMSILSSLPNSPTNGQTTKLTMYEFFTRGPIQAALSWEVYPGFGTTPYISGDLFEAGFNVGTKETQFVQTPHRVFPNPVSERRFQLEIEKESAKNWTLQIYTGFGQLVQTEAISSNNTSVKLNDNLLSGHYFYTILNENNEFAANGKFQVID